MHLYSAEDTPESGHEDATLGGGEDQHYTKLFLLCCISSGAKSTDSKCRNLLGRAGST